MTELDETVDYIFTSRKHGEPTKYTEISEMPEGWRVAQMGAVARIERGKFTHRPRNDPAFYGGAIPFIQTGDVTASDGHIRTYSQTLNEQGLSVSKVFPKGTIVITIAANIGYTGILEFESAFPDSMIGITPYEGVDGEYLNYYLITQQPEMDRKAPQGTQKNINIEFLSPWPIIIPPLSEQRAIAHTLHTLQEAIQTRRREADLERERKAALLQHLFTSGTQGDETKQTKIGLLPHNWLTVQFPEVVTIVQGQVNPTQEPYNTMLHIGPENIEPGTGKLLGPLKTAQELKLISGKYLFSAEHVLYAKINPYLKKAALPSSAGICSADMYPLLPRSELLLREFLFYLLLSESFTSQAVSFQDRTGIPKINRNQLGLILLPLPPLDEQEEISAPLLACDTKIAALEQEIALLYELFRALLEELTAGRFSALPLVAVEVAHE